VENQPLIEEDSIVLFTVFGPAPHAGEAGDSIDGRPVLRQGTAAHGLQRGKRRPLFREELRLCSPANLDSCHQSTTTRKKIAASRQIRPRSGKLLLAFCHSTATSRRASKLKPTLQQPDPPHCHLRAASPSGEAPDWSRRRGSTLNRKGVERARKVEGKESVL
jgi:hypothetical protein